MILPTTLLSDEHRIILRMLSCLERFCLLSRPQGKLQPGQAGEMIDFIQNYSDKWHHLKEEDLLFPMLEAKGLPRDGGPVGVMLQEHDMGRAFVGRMKNAIQGAEAGVAGDLQNFIDGALSFVELLRGHIQKEDRILYPLANRVMEDADQERLAADFKRVETQQGGDIATRYERLAERWGETFGVPPVEEHDHDDDDMPPCHGGCGHHH